MKIIDLSNSGCRPFPERSKSGVQSRYRPPYCSGGLASSSFSRLAGCVQGFPVTLRRDDFRGPKGLSRWRSGEGGESSYRRCIGPGLTCNRHLRFVNRCANRRRPTTAVPRHSLTYPRRTPARRKTRGLSPTHLGTRLHKTSERGAPSPPTTHRTPPLHPRGPGIEVKPVIQGPRLTGV